MNVSMKKIDIRNVRIQDNKISWALSVILYFDDSKFKISESLVSLELTSVLKSSLNENNLNQIEFPYF